MTTTTTEPLCSCKHSLAAHRNGLRCYAEFLPGSMEQCECEAFRAGASPSAASGETPIDAAYQQHVAACETCDGGKARVLCPEGQRLHDTADRDWAELGKLRRAASGETGATPLDSLVAEFAAALLAKLKASEVKYGWSDGWQTCDLGELRGSFARHIAKGDPIDVAAYSAFLWKRGESTRPVVAHITHSLGSDLAALRERVEKAEAENADLQAAFDLQWAADQRARERWRVAHPGNDLVWPDRADLVLWLMERAERLDWLAAQGNDTGWIARSSSTGRGYRLHQPGPHPDPGSAIDAARAPSTPSASTGEPS